MMKKYSAVFYMISDLVRCFDGLLAGMAQNLRKEK
jgi:hypothetical protein